MITHPPIALRPIVSVLGASAPSGLFYLPTAVNRKWRVRAKKRQ
jgi:hypothetical protein